MKSPKLSKPMNFHRRFIVRLFNIIMLLDLLVVSRAQNTVTTPVNVGVVLDLDSLVGKMGLSCINMALSDFYATNPHYNTRLVLKIKDSKEDVVAAAAAAVDLIRNVQVQAIIGPRSSMQANFVINLGNKSQVPIISFTATSPSLTSMSSYFFRAAQSDSFQVKAISAIVQAFRWREVVPIYVDNLFGESIVPYLTDTLQEINTRVPYLCVIPASATDDEIAKQLQILMTRQTRVFIVHMTMPLGYQILAKAKEIGMMSEGYVWIMTDIMTTMWRSLNASAFDSLQGVLGVRTYVRESEKLENFEVRWKRKFLQDYPNTTNAELNLFGLWAYDATFALAMAIEKAGTANLRFNETNISSGGATDLETLGVSLNGPRLIQELSKTKVRGLSGDFRFDNGQLPSSVFQIVNVNGNGEKRVGFWTPESGLVKKYTSTNSTSKPKLGPIIWPGDTTSVPRGWEMPTYGKRMKIGVPVKVGFTEFVEVVWDPIAQKEKSIRGYSIDVFDAVMDKLPYAVPYDYVPFATPEGKTAGSYNDLIDQVYHGNYDAVAGDVSIVANRSMFADFTLPYTESGERVVSNLARFVVIIWCFVVLILIQSYTASLASLLTVDRLQPTITDINELLKRKDNIGFQDGSYIEGILLGLKFDKNQLKKFSSPEDLHDLFSKGSANGGISAAVDEIPYVKIFLGKYCGKYTTVKPTFKTDGLGFVFPKGSPLVADVSRAILNVAQGDEMERIQNSWFMNEPNCSDFNPSASSNSLGLESFWGLFLIAGVASISALIIFAAMFLYEQRHVLFKFQSETSMWRKIQVASRIFDQKDLSSHTFRKDASSTCSVHSIGAAGSSPNTNCPPSPSSLSTQTDSADFVFFVEQARITGHGDMTPGGSASPDTFTSPERSSVELANYRHGP
ncbi:hypothetical protein DITRI_Ditri10aG0141400 [Diplodiscus trichospermus]